MKIRNKILANILFLSFTFLNAETISFSNVYDLALENFDELKSKELQLKANKERIEQTKSKLYPQVNFSVSANRMDYEVNNKIVTSQYDIKEESIDSSLSLSQTIYNPEIFDRITEEKIKNKIYDYELKLEKFNTAKDLLNIYMQLIISNYKIVSLNTNISFTQSQYEAASKKYEMNLINKIDFLDTKIEYENSKIELEKEKQLFAVYKKQLQKYIDTNEFEIPQINVENFKLNKLILLKNSVINNQKTINNYLIEQAKLKIKLAKIQKNLAKSGFYPSVNLSINYTDYNTDDTTSDYENYQKIMLKLDYPLFQGGYTNSRVRESKLYLLSAKKDLDLEIKNSNINYEENLAKFKSSSQSLLIYINAIESSILYKDAMSQALEKGLKSKIELYDASKKINNIKVKFLQTLNETLSSYIELSIILGKTDNIKYIDDILK